MLKFIALLLILFEIIHCQEILSTDYECASKVSRLACPDSTAIFISSINHKYAPDLCGPIEKSQRVDLNKNLDSQVLRECVGIDLNDERILRECNGKQKCAVQIENKSHITGFYGTNCDFQSNYAKIFYTCVPNTLRRDVKSFDICERNGPEVVLGLDSGFIQSPSYPSYYGNKRNCLINIGVPDDKRLILYLISLNLEGLSIVDGKPRDFLVIENETELYGKLKTPMIIYNGSDRERVQLKFRSDWITTTSLNSPKGFLIFFQLVNKYSVEQITVEPVPITDSLVKETTKLFPANDLLDEDTLLSADHLSQKRAAVPDGGRNDDHAVTIISVLVGVIGILIIVIFGLLLLFRKRNSLKASKYSKPKHQNEEDHIYDVADEKSISNIYNTGDYTNSSLNSGSMSKSIVTANTTAYSQSNNTTTTSASSAPSTKFSSRLRNFYRTLSQTLSLSSKVLSESKDLDASLSSRENPKKMLDITSESKTYNINEFNPNDCDIKYEKGVAIDTLKLCKTAPTNSFKRAMDMYKRNSSDQQLQVSNINESLNKSENFYVSNPIENSTMISSGKRDESMSADGKTKRLQIYEVNFENNFAYLTTSTATSPPAPSTATIPTVTISSDQSGADATLNKSDLSNSEIYHTINETDPDQTLDHIVEETESETESDEDNQNGDDSLSIIYQTPSNKLLNTSNSSNTNNKKMNNTTTSLEDENQNSSVMHLLNENNTANTTANTTINNETQA